MVSNDFSTSSLPGSVTVAGTPTLNAGSNQDGWAFGDNVEAMSAQGSAPGTLHGGTIDLGDQRDEANLINADGSDGADPADTGSMHPDLDELNG